MEPSDQRVVLGRNAVFHCKTRSSKAYWSVNNDTFEFVERYYHFPEYKYSNSSDSIFYNVSLTIFTSKTVSNLTVRCFYVSSTNGTPYNIHHTRTATLTTFSCLG